MGSASRIALTVAKAAVTKATASSVATGVALLAAGRSIAQVPAIRNALANPIADAKAKATLIDATLGKLDGSAKQLLQSIVSERWSSAAEMLDGIEEIGIRSIASAAGKGIEAELFAVRSAIQAHPELELALGSKRGSAESKVKLAGSVLKGTSEATTEIVNHLVASLRGRKIRAMLVSAENIAADTNGKGLATVTVSAKLDAAQLDRIQTILKKKYGREHHIDEIIDDSIVGGFTIQVGNDTIDASIRSRLNELSAKLAG